ncbi:hypothetical protein TRFO_17987 [Tritrichomonas foetus]|uniref:Uncharacterized protein n=1 Tax=Tritrichomonas foetus TaxID=1144522 RepID=A0A1J4KM44_9EUKA|nr:hypothetical protein TRFO_17987 [Tritrichomonas foetus]|eukprot:OHT12291.1 hypothetical protein TRFO_17987 [Tritrichomonas foetus]
MPPRKKKQPEKPPSEDEEDSAPIAEGMNDLMRLPIETIQEELIRRGYHPGMIRKFPQNYLVAILREETNTNTQTKKFKGNFITKRAAKMRNPQQPIFAAKTVETSKGDKDDDEEDEGELPELDAAEFKQATGKQKNK